MAVAWFQQHALPRPGAVGASVRGDDARRRTGSAVTRPTPLPRSARAARLRRCPTEKPPARVPLGYFEGVDVTDPLVAPRQFARRCSRSFRPPSSYRARALSSSAPPSTRTRCSSNRASRRTCTSWEGMFHGFFYNVDVPESRDCYDVIVKFFDRHLGQNKGTRP